VVNSGVTLPALAQTYLCSSVKFIYILGYFGRFRAVFGKKTLLGVQYRVDYAAVHSSRRGGVPTPYQEFILGRHIGGPVDRGVADHLKCQPVDHAEAPHARAE